MTKYINGLYGFIMLDLETLDRCQSTRKILDEKIDVANRSITSLIFEKDGIKYHSVVLSAEHILWELSVFILNSYET